MPAELVELQVADLHRVWDEILERGLKDIKHDMQPNWRIEDVYSALRMQQVSCVLPRRLDRWLGFMIYSRQLRVFSFEPECFIWCTWNLPMREWQDGDDMLNTNWRVYHHVAHIAKTQYQCDQITWITRPGRAKAFARKFGFRPSWVTMTAQVPA